MNTVINIYLVGKPVTNPITGLAYKAPPYSMAPNLPGPYPAPPKTGLSGETVKDGAGLPYLQ